VRGGGAEEAADPGAQGPRRGRLAETVDQGVVEEAGGYRAARHEQDRHPGVVVQDLTGEFRPDITGMSTSVVTASTPPSAASVSNACLPSAANATS